MPVILRAQSISITAYPVPTNRADATQIALGPDGALWFTEQENKSNKIGRITTSGSITEYVVPTSRSRLCGIAAGPDGALWFTEYDANQIVRITTDGAITEWPIPTRRERSER